LSEFEDGVCGALASESGVVNGRAMPRQAQRPQLTFPQIPLTISLQFFTFLISHP